MSVEEVLLKPKEERIKELDNLIKAGELELKYIEDYIFSSNDTRLIYLCGKHIEWINKGRVANTLSKKIDSYYILEYAHFIQNLKDLLEEEKKKILNELSKGMIRSKDPIRMYYYARDIMFAPIEKLATAMAKYDNSTYIFYMLRGIGSKLNPETKELLERRVIELKDPRYIVAVANIATIVSINEFAEGLLNAKKTDIYAVHLSMFLKDHEVDNKDSRDKIIKGIVESKDYIRIIDLIKNTENTTYIGMIDYILNENITAKKTDFWLNYIITLAICNRPCSSYAVDKIIESKNVEIITIAIYYMENEELREKLQNALNGIPNLDDEYKGTKLTREMILRVRKDLK